VNLEQAKSLLGKVGAGDYDRAKALAELSSGTVSIVAALHLIIEEREAQERLEARLA
jgi:hypothetical protein